MTSEEKLTEVLKAIDLSAEAGMCYFTAQSKHEYLYDIRKLVASVGIQGGVVAVKTSGKES